MDPDAPQPVDVKAASERLGFSAELLPIVVGLSDPWSVSGMSVSFWPTERIDTDGGMLKGPLTTPLVVEGITYDTIEISSRYVGEHVKLLRRGIWICVGGAIRNATTSDFLYFVGSARPQDGSARLTKILQTPHKLVYRAKSAIRRFKTRHFRPEPVDTNEDKN